ncbi:MAG: O-antigen ligase family protein, partial [Elusimicrobiota bacterium]|nr:O-antigen ligase family protein [Elusimicrobiota bacterium]
SIQATMLNPNIFAGYLIMVIPMIVYASSQVRPSSLHTETAPLLHRSPASTRRSMVPFITYSLTCLLSVICVVCLLLTKSIGAICSLLCAFSIVKLGLRRGILLVAILLTATLLIKFSDHDLINRYFWWESTLQIAKDNSIFGTGVGTYEYVYPKYKISTLSTMFAHNYFLQLLSEIGIIGLVIFVIFIFLAVSNIQNPYYKISILAILFQNLFDYSLYIPANAILFWCILSLGKEKNPLTIDVTENITKKLKNVIYILLLVIYANSVFKVYLSTRYYNAGKNFLEKNSTEKALKYFKKAIAVKSNMWLVYPEIAKINLIKSSKSNYKSYLYEAQIYLEETKKYNQCYR